MTLDREQFNIFWDSIDPPGSVDLDDYDYNDFTQQAVKRDLSLYNSSIHEEIKIPSIFVTLYEEY